jgi:hypothetical protein
VSALGGERKVIMNFSLPPNPSLEQLRKQAKGLLKLHKQRDSGCCAVLRRLRQFAHASEAEILASEVALNDVQFALAIHYGYDGWAALKKHVESLPAGEIPEELVRNLQDVGEIFERVIKETCDAYWQPRSYVYCQLVCMKAAGWNDVEYETLMPVSGFGISFAYHPNDKFWAHYAAPPGADEWIAEATGFGWEWVRLDTPEEYWSALKETLDAGKVIHAPWLEEVLFVGYEEVAEERGRKVYPLATGPVDVRTGQSWRWEEFEKWFREHSHRFLGRHTERVPGLPAREMATKVMRNIVMFAHNDPRANNNAFTGVHFGLAGIEAYASDIADLSKSGKKDEYFQAGWLGCHNIYPQWTARQLTGRYLKRASEQFAENIRMHVLAAAKQYEAAHAAWKEWERYLGAFELVKRPEDAWENPQHRKAGAVSVCKALESEKAAVAEIEQALRELEKETTN